MTPLGPMAVLPPLGRLLSFPNHTIHLALQNLRLVYFPQPSPVFAPKSRPPFSANSPSRNGDETPFVDSGYASAEEEENDSSIAGRISLAPAIRTKFPPPHSADVDEEALEILRGDAFERAFAIKWLTGFISRADTWIAEVEEGSPEETVRSDLLEQAITILSSFTSEDNEEEFDLTRSFTFQTSNNGETPGIEVELNDAPITSDDHTSVGLQSWGSCILFAEKICSCKEAFLSDSRPLESRTTPLRILELGAGTGMLSIITAKLLATMTPPPEVVATDYHPEVLANLAMNIETNFPPSRGKPAPVSVHVLDWESPTDAAPFDKPFDIILGADVVYHPDHARWIAACVSKLLRRPLDEDKGGVFWMFMAIRGTGRHENLDKLVDATFVRKEALVWEDGEGSDDRLVLLEQEDVQRRGGIGRADENGYKLSKIGWV